MLVSDLDADRSSSGGNGLRRGVGVGGDGELGLELEFGRFGSGGGLFAGCQRAAGAF